MIFSWWLSDVAGLHYISSTQVPIELFARFITYLQTALNNSAEMKECYMLDAKRAKSTSLKHLPMNCSLIAST